MNQARSRTALGLATLLLLIGACLLVFSGTAHNLLQPGGTTVQAVFANTQLLVKGSPVRYDGVQVGTVTATRLNPGKRTAAVDMSITDSSVLPLYRDATATLKWRTILGSNYAIDLTRGTPAAGPLSPAIIPSTRTTGQIEVDQFASLLGAQQRQGLQSTLAQLPHAFSDPTAPVDALNTLAQVSPTVAAGAATLQGENVGDLHALISNAAHTARALDAPDASLLTLIQGGAATLTATAIHTGDIQGTLDDAAAALPQVQSTLTQLNTTLTLANPLIARLRTDAPSVAPAIRDLHPTVTDANLLLQSARPLLSSLQPTARALKAFSRRAEPLLTNLMPSLRQVAGKILPDLALVYTGSHRATYEMIGPTIAALDAAAGALDGAGHFVTLTAGGGSNLLDTLPCRTYINNPDATQLAACENLLSYVEQLFGGASPAGLSPAARTK
jgi:phospholipid/cholesterol/gamma-HCH transport system substrate-binding protein